jgi:hypothetical protein
LIGVSASSYVCAVLPLLLGPSHFASTSPLFDVTRPVSRRRMFLSIEDTDTSDEESVTTESDVSVVEDSTDSSDSESSSSSSEHKSTDTDEAKPQPAVSVSGTPMIAQKSPGISSVMKGATTRFALPPVVNSKISKRPSSVKQPSSVPAVVAAVAARPFTPLKQQDRVDGPVSGLPLPPPKVDVDLNVLDSSLASIPPHNFATVGFWVALVQFRVALQRVIRRVKSRFVRPVVASVKDALYQSAAYLLWSQSNAANGGSFTPVRVVDVFPDGIFLRFFTLWLPTLLFSSAIRVPTTRRARTHSCFWL